MIAHRIRLRTTRLRFAVRKLAPSQRCRLNSTSASPVTIHGPSSGPTLEAIASQIDQIAPRIDISAEQIEILDGPKEFYDTLKQKIRKARKRIYLSTLYIGKTEHELISRVHEALAQAQELQVSILTDALRGTREDPDPSCASLLASLLASFPERVEIRMYHTPNLTGLRKRLIPKRINEGWGLQHMKLYGIDDEVILSGANLSSDYFTNRQDRYHVFSSKRVSDYFSRIHHAVCSISFLLQASPSMSSPSHKLIWPSSNPAPNPLQDPKSYIKAATSLLLPFSSPTVSPGSPLQPSTDSVSSQATETTTLYPLLCHTPILNTELHTLTTLFSSPSLTSYTFTAGYFNPHPLITRSLLTLSSPPRSAHGTILTASPHANGFFNSKGVSGMLPAAYTHLSLRFLQAARRARANIRLREWQRATTGEEGGWTYHAKGVWAHFPEGNGVGPSVTVIGSSNYTSRSYGLDLEVGALVLTDDVGLMRKWRREEEGLRAWTREVQEKELEGKERRAGWRVRVAMWIVKIVGGAL
ncbi:MAG: hypothetical protein L6R35_001120 [Caloplaca aegaea]|nr:MAG: hypothetical protein L6R35_001120 [Caloplaca aegaea]